MAHLQEGCPNNTQRGSLCAIPLKKVKYKVKKQEATNIEEKIFLLANSNPHPLGK
jgi:hypothetical protein